MRYNLYNSSLECRISPILRCSIFILFSPFTVSSHFHQIPNTFPPYINTCKQARETFHIHFFHTPPAGFLSCRLPLFLKLKTRLLTIIPERNPVQSYIPKIHCLLSPSKFPRMLPLHLVPGTIRLRFPNQGFFCQIFFRVLLFRTFLFQTSLCWTFL